MKKLIYCLPAAVMASFCLFVAARGAGSLGAFALGVLALLSAAGAFLCAGKWAGCLFGAAAGLWLTAMGLEEHGQIFGEYIIGLPLCAYYIVCGLICRRGRKSP